MQNVLIVTLCIALVVGLLVGFLIGNMLPMFLGFTLPVIIFISTFLLVTGLRKKILSSLKKTFGENVVKIAAAIIEYFEVPLTIILSVSLTLFIIAITAILIYSSGT